MTGHVDFYFVTICIILYPPFSAYLVYISFHYVFQIPKFTSGIIFSLSQYNKKYKNY